MSHPLRQPLKLNGVIVMEMLEHAVREHPIEACGMLVGPSDGDPVSCWPMRNALASNTRFAFDPDEQLRAWAQMDRLGWDPLVIYHSHTASPAAPSRYDHAHSFEPNTTYVIISTAHEEPTVMAWRRLGDTLVEVPIEIG